MFGNFSYCNPTKLYFGEDALENLIVELAKYGNNVALVYGSGSIKKTEFMMKSWIFSNPRVKRCQR